MTRIRTIKPEFFRNDDLYTAELECGLPLRLAYIGLWTCADREGRFKWHPRRLKLDIFPYDENIDMEKVLNELNRFKFIQKYAAEGIYYAYIPTWKKHQLINTREAQSSIPSPENCTKFDILPVHARALQVSSLVTHVHARGEGEGEGEREEDLLTFANAKVNCRFSCAKTDQCEHENQNLNEKESENASKNETVVSKKELKNEVMLDDCPHKEIIALYHEILPEGTRVEHWTRQRAANLRQRWREDKRHQSLKFWDKFFKHIRESKFLMGKVSSAGREPFQLSLDSIIRPKMFSRITENYYHRDFKQ